MARAARAVYGNPSSTHRLGAEAARLVTEARESVSTLLGVSKGDTVFCGGGTEANALAILGGARRGRGKHVVISAIEHPCVLQSAQLLAEQGYDITKVAPRTDGSVTPEAVAQAVRADTVVVAVMLVNNELGTVLPVRAIAQAVRAAGSRALIHTDAVQAVGMMAVNPEHLGVDSVALSAHKFHGPRGIGALWVRNKARLAPLWGGGGQEQGLRSGTENVPAMAGLKIAAEQISETRTRAEEIAQLRQELIDGLCQVTNARPTVPSETHTAPHIASVTFSGLPAEPLLHALESLGVFAAAGSACASRKRGPSHVLRAIGVSDNDAVLRFSLAHTTTSDHIRASILAAKEAYQAVAPVVTPQRTP